MKKYVVLGGTGTLGSTLLKHLAGLDEQKEIVCLSRDELKQQQLRAKFPGVGFVIGDIRDKGSLEHVLMNAYTVFHVAAMKHIDVVQENPLEGVKTNVYGTENVAKMCIDRGVRHCVFSSTDKAVEPINVYGMTKAISERYLLGLNARQNVTKFSVFRWGNVLGSRGSVLHAFKKSLLEDGTINLTHPNMSRFWIHIDEAVQFMLETYRQAPTDRACIPKMKGSKVADLACVMAHLLGVKSMTVNITGMREGEKIAECIEVDGDRRVTSDSVEWFTSEELAVVIKPLLGALV